MKVNIIVPTFNRAEILPRAIESILSQTYKNFDLTIVDDGSTDNTYQVVKKYLELDHVRYVRTDNRGVSAARNMGVSLSSGDYVSFLDSDDLWHADKLELQMNFLKENTHIECVHGEEIWVRNGKRVNKKKVHQKFGGDIFKECLPLCFISPSTVIISRSVFEEINGFDEEFVVCEDYDLWLKISSLYEVGFIETPIMTKFGGHADQLSTKYFAMDYFRVKSLANILEIRELSLTQREQVIENILKKSEILLKGYKKHNNLKNYDEIEQLLISFR
ncbi:hypothetical protein A9Q84_10610 [Halobacteriovorax marinus]|uniref:Glycosyltransferase 2-like domain-containing protein n=1 Tax=Halobacteriovorax marinus TaxID=97084 RepID=A0A1Y5F7N4_9BACT|nr:hypothetical protein A9Q84_10610 [Halobacteriovorax marinus]